MDIRSFFGGGGGGGGGKKPAAKPATTEAPSSAKKKKAAKAKPTAAGSAKRKAAGGGAAAAAAAAAGGIGGDENADSPAVQSRFFAGDDAPESGGKRQRAADAPRAAPAAAAAGPTPGDVAKWTFDGKKAGAPAHAYPDDISAQLEEAWQRFSSSDGASTMGVNGDKYVIDFESMEQRNEGTGKIRAVHRVGPAVKPKPNPKPKPKPNPKVAPATDFHSKAAAKRKAAPAAAKGSGEAKPKQLRAAGSKSAAWFGRRKPPPMQGLKVVPLGADNCLAGLSFLITGTLESLERDECEELIKKYAGSIIKSVPKKKKLDFAIVGEEAGVKKLEQLAAANIEQIDEEGLFAMIRRTCKQPDPELEPEPEPIVLPPAPVAVASSAASSSGGQPAPAPVLLWTDRYRPQGIKEIMGNQQATQKLNVWLKNWHVASGSKKSCVAALLSGPPGIGKTTAAHAIARDLGFKPVEFNASDVRSKKLLGSQIEKMVSSRSVDEFFSSASTVPKKNVLIMDEVDGMSSGDRGGMAELIRLIQKSKIPIICCCNDETHQKVRSLIKHCQHIPFSKARPFEVLARVKAIARTEGLNIGDEALQNLCEGSNGDIRQMITCLQMWKTDSNGLTSADVTKRMASSSKNVLQRSVHDLLKDVWKPDTSLDDAINCYFRDSEILSLYVQESYPNQKPAAKQPNGGRRDLFELDLLAKAADSFSDADIAQQYVRGKQRWDLMPTHAVLSTARPGKLLSGRSGGRVGFPMILGKMSQLNKRKRLLSEVGIHTASVLSSARSEIRMYYSFLFQVRMAMPMSQNMGKDVGGIDEVIAFMDAYGLTREDWSTFMEEFSQLQPLPLQFKSSTKSAFTRKFNAQHLETTKIKHREAPVDSGDESEEEEDNLVQKKKKPATKKKAAKKRKLAAKKKKMAD